MVSFSFTASALFFRVITFLLAGTDDIRDIDTLEARIT
jgi:hypothetical protein